MVGETGREGNMAHRAERRQSERAGRYWAGCGAQGAGEFCVVAIYFAQFMQITRNSLLSSLPSFDTVNETGREGMARRAERRRLGRAGRYWAGGGA
jgi:hypothetical protein